MGLGMGLGMGMFNPLFSRMMFPNAPVGVGATPMPLAPGQQATLFVRDLPRDVTEREMSLLFRFLPGYARCRLVSHHKPAICFVDFTDVGSAMLAMQTFHGYRVDLDSPPLTIEFDQGRSHSGGRGGSGGGDGSGVFRGGQHR
jgi:uncharacterized membrane protein YgcG